MRPRDREQITTPPDGRSSYDQPQWRHDFPIDWPEDEYVARRDFAKFLVLTSFAFTVGQLWIVLKGFMRKGDGPLPGREIARLDAVPIGGALAFDYPNPHDSCLLMRTAENEVIAYSQKCTHLSCPVVPAKDLSKLHCPCHNGTFDMRTGLPTGGPPRRPLPIVSLEIRNGVIFATDVTERT